MSTQSCLEEEQKQTQEAPESPRSVPLPPSSPRARPSSRRQAPRASSGSRTSQPGPDLRSQALPSASGPALRSRATLRSPAACCCCAPQRGRAVRRPLSAPDPASSRHTALRPRFHVSNQASGSGTALPSHRSLPGPARRRRSVSTSSRALQCSAFVPGSATHSYASGSGPALNNYTSLPGTAPRSLASGPSPALQSLSNPVSPAPTSSSSSTAGFVSKSRPSGRRSTAGSCPPLPGPADQRPPSRGLALGRLVLQSSSSSPDAEAPSLPSQQGWHAVRMRASSPSPPGRLLPYPGLFDESSSSSAPNSPSSSSSSSSFSTYPQSPGPYPSSHEIPAQGPSSPPTNFSGHGSSSSSPTFPGLASISTPSPASLRRALLLELDDLSPASPGEEAETESISFPPTSPEL